MIAVERIRRNLNEGFALAGRVRGDMSLGEILMLRI